MRDRVPSASTRARAAFSAVMRALVVVLAGFVVGCASTMDLKASQALEQNKAKWNAAHVRDYRFVLSWRSTVFSPERIGPNQISVRNDRMVTATHIGEGGPYEDGDDVTQKLESPTTVDALFAFIAKELKGRDLWPVVVDYDEALGYPHKITLGDPHIMDGADFIEVTELVRE
jgi:Family of unknown function (DUF6174)